MPFYAVKVGRKPGVYSTWDECNLQVKGFPGCKFKKFNSESEALDFANLPASGVIKRKAPDDYPVQKTYKHGSSVLHSNSLSGNVFSLEIPKVTSSKASFYAVHRGKQRGVYRTWTECEMQIKDFKNPSYRKFTTEEEALEFVKTGGIKKLNRREAKRVPMNYEFVYEEEPVTEFTLEDVKVDAEKFVSVFTDGASSKNGRVGAAAGIGVFWGPNHPLNTSMRLPGRQTNNRAEIFAATHALRQAKIIGAKNIKLYTDSQFLIHGITDWIQKWKKNNWKLANGEPVKNKDDFIELDKAREGLNVEFIYIKAHDNNPGNVEADKLAVAGARMDLQDTFVIKSMLRECVPRKDPKEWLKGKCEENTEKQDEIIACFECIDAYTLPQNVTRDDVKQMRKDCLPKQSLKFRNKRRCTKKFSTKSEIETCQECVEKFELPEKPSCDEIKEMRRKCISGRSGREMWTEPMMDDEEEEE